MASPGAIAQMNNTALKRLQAVTDALSTKLQLPSITPTFYGREPGHLQAQRLSALADTLERVNAALDGYTLVVTDAATGDTTLNDGETGALIADLPDQPIDPELVTVAELKALADARGLDYPANIRKADLIALLKPEGKPDGSTDG